MKAREIGNMQCDFYRYIEDRVPQRSVSLKEFLCHLGHEKHFSELLQYVRAAAAVDNKVETRRAKKDYLPAAMISCRCGGRKDVVTERRGLIALDFDYADTPRAFADEECIAKVKRWIFSFTYIYAVSISCSGKGIFAVAVVEDSEHPEKHFKALERDWKKLGLVLDPQTKNVNRLRYLSQDPNILIKDDETEVTAYDKVYYEIPNLPNPAPAPQTNKERSSMEKTNKVGASSSSPAFILNTVKFIVDRGYCAHNYNEWLCDAARLAKIDYYNGLEAFRYISEHSQGYTSDEAVVAKFDNQCACSPFEGDSYLYYLKKAKEYDVGWYGKVLRMCEHN